MVNKGKLSPECPEMNNSIDRLEGLRNMLQFILDFLKLLLRIQQLVSLLSCLLEDLSLLLCQLDQLIILHELIKITIVVVDDFHLIGTLVERINIGS